MIPTFVPRLATPPISPEVVIIGAGAAGIAAARTCMAAGRSVTVIEARDRVGGRAVTAMLEEHPVDLGAHWMHAGIRNPLVVLAEKRGEPLRRASKLGRQLRVGRHWATSSEWEDYAKAWEQAERAYDAFAGPDRAFDDVLPPLGPWRKVIESAEVLLSGRPLAEVSFADQPGDDLYEDNRFIAGGYGAYLARLADGLPIRTGCQALSVDWSGGGVTVETSEGTIRARAAIVAVPINVLREGGLRFSPMLPSETADAIRPFLVGTYEHVILHWPNAPFKGDDRFATLVGAAYSTVSLLTRIDGSHLHYMELNHCTVEAMGADPAEKRRFAHDLLRQSFSEAELTDCRVLCVTDWRDDRFSKGAWGVLPPGERLNREVLTRPIADRIWFAGEALAGPQWSTVGGAWGHGERAAREVAAALR